MRRGLSGWLVVALASLPATLSAENFELPIRLLLDTGAMAIELSNADVRVSFEQVEEPYVSVSAKPTQDEVPGLLAVSEHGPTLMLERAPVEERAARWDLELVLVPGQPLRIAGAELNVSARSAESPSARRAEILLLKEESKEEGEKGGAPQSSLELQLERSQADLRGLEGIILQTSRTSLWLADTGGSLSLDLSGGSVESADHHGTVQLSLDAADATFTNLVGNLSSEGEGGSLTLQGGSGSLNATLAGGGLAVSERRGRMEVETERSAIEIRSIPSRTPLGIKAYESEIEIEGVPGPLTANLDAGILTATDLGGQVTLSGEGGAAFEVSGAPRQVGLDLAEGCEATISDIGHLTAELTESTLRLERAKQVKLSGSIAEVFVQEIEHLAPLRMSDSVLELDLKGIANRPTLELTGTGSARVTLSLPCVVRKAAVDSGFDANLQVTGCEIRNPGQRIVAARGRLLYGTNQPVMLVVAAGEGFEVEVEGTP